MVMPISPSLTREQRPEPAVGTLWAVLDTHPESKKSDESRRPARTSNCGSRQQRGGPVETAGAPV